MAIETVKYSLTSEERRAMYDLCRQRGFSIDSYGNIFVGRKRMDKDDVDPEVHTIEGTTLLKPVGFLGRSAELTYTEEPEFHVYHSELRKIFTSN